MSRTERTRRPRRSAIAMAMAVETLEGRALLSAGMSPGVRGAAASVRPAFTLPGGGGGAIKTDPAGVAAVLAALRGGAGSEFVTLIRRQVPNLSGVIAGFVSGRTTQFTTPGVAAKIPKFQQGYTGTRYDHLTATLAGAVLLPNRTLELAMVTRGPFDEAAPSFVVFGLDRGAGARLGPAFAGRPGLTPDALVTVAVGPFGRRSTATVTDLTTGAVTSIDASKVIVQGATVRVFVDLAKIPSQGRPVGSYTFAAWTRARTTGGIEAVGSFVPETSMIPIGVLNPQRIQAKGR